jgi:hypothetical protein
MEKDIRWLQRFENYCEALKMVSEILKEYHFEEI